MCHMVKMATSTSNTDAESTVIRSSENVDPVDSEGGSDGTSSSTGCQRPVVSLLERLHPAPKAAFFVHGLFCTPFENVEN